MACCRLSDKPLLESVSSLSHIYTRSDFIVLKFTLISIDIFIDIYARILINQRSGEENDRKA